MLESNIRPVRLVKKRTKKGVSSTEITTFEDGSWSLISDLKMTDLRFICRDHGFMSSNKFSDETKEEKRQVFLNSLKMHLREVHKWNFETSI